VDPGIAMICAWCHALIARGTPCAGFECNYGMCRACVNEQLARLAPRPRLARTPRHAARSIAAHAPQPPTPA
jgi:hypothetical protein